MEGWEVNPDMPYSSVSPNFPKFITWILTVNGDINDVSTSCCRSKHTGGSNSGSVMGVNVDWDVGILFPDSTYEPEKVVSAILRLGSRDTYNLAASGFNRPAMSLTPITCIPSLTSFSTKSR